MAASAVDDLEMTTTSARLQTVLPRANTITTQSLYRLSLELRSSPDQTSRAAGNQRFAIYDTNAYREFTFGLSLDGARIKTDRLCQLEQAAGWSVLAHPIVVWELVAHLEDTADKAYDHCLKASVALGEHTASRERRRQHKPHRRCTFNGLPRTVRKASARLRAGPPEPRKLRHLRRPKRTFHY